MHGTIESALRVEWRPLVELGDGRGAVARARRTRDRAQRLLRAVIRSGSRAGASAPMPAPAWSGRAQRRLFGFFPPASSVAATASRCRCWWDGRIPTRRSARRWWIATMCEPVIDAWLDHIARHPQFPKLLLLPYLPVDRPLAARLIARSNGAAEGLHPSDAISARLACAGRERAGLSDKGDRGKKRKELRRQRKRLGDLGSVTVTDARRRARLPRALDDFFALEGGGWKGRAGTAARCNDAIARFMQAAVPRLRPKARRRSCALCMGDQPISALVMLRSGGNAWCWKIAYDESSRALLARRTAAPRSDREAALRPFRRPYRFLRHARSSHDRPCLARAARCCGSVDTPRSGTAAQIWSDMRAGGIASSRSWRRQGRAKASVAEIAGARKGSVGVNAPSHGHIST